MEKVNTFEEWKQIKDFPNYYISNLGNIKSKAYKKERILKQYKDYRGYKSIRLYNYKLEGKKKNIRVHRLVA